jgi:hypothetical protein
MELSKPDGEDDFSSHTTRAPITIQTFPDHSCYDITLMAAIIELVLHWDWDWLVDVKHRHHHSVESQEPRLTAGSVLQELKIETHISV